jgi:hypothetical protein
MKATSGVCSGDLLFQLIGTREGNESLRNSVALSGYCRRKTLKRLRAANIDSEDASRRDGVLDPARHGNARRLG